MARRRRRARSRPGPRAVDQRPHDVCVRAGAPRRRRRARRWPSHGVAALSRVFHDDEHGGWFDGGRPDGHPGDDRQALLRARLRAARRARPPTAAGAAARRGAAGRGRAVHAGAVLGRGRRTLRRAAAAGTGRRPSPYRGANSNMHTVEAVPRRGRRHGRRDVARSGRWRSAERIIGIHARGPRVAHPRALRPRLDARPRLQRTRHPPIRSGRSARRRAMRSSGRGCCAAGGRPGRAAAVAAGGGRGVVRAGRRRRDRRRHPGPGLHDRLARRGRRRASASTGSWPRRCWPRRRCTRTPARRLRGVAPTGGGPRSPSTSSTRRPGRGTTSCRPRWSPRRAPGTASPTRITPSTP